MIFSMTAFARRQLEQDWGSMTWELRSVNHRYLECSFRLPETLRGLEPAIRDALRKKLSRGKVECQLRFQPSEGSQSVTVDQDQVARLRQANASILESVPEAEPLSVAEYLRWPGVLKEQEADLELLEQEALSLFDAALNDLVDTRRREGAELGRYIDQRLASIGEIVADVRGWMPEILERQRANIVERLGELKLELEATRLEQELVMLAQKSDVDEELDRLESHLGEVSRVLTTDGQKGRRLDFLMQELNREANTLSSKSIVAATTRSAVELKVLIEQMREQIQNIE